MLLARVWDGLPCQLPHQFGETFQETEKKLFQGSEKTLLGVGETPWAVGRKKTLPGRGSEKPRNPQPVDLFIRQFNASPLRCLWENDAGENVDVFQGGLGEQGDAFVPMLFRALVAVAGGRTSHGFLGRRQRVFTC